MAVLMTGGAGKKGKSVRISVIGTGYLGTVHAASMTEIGHDVLGVDSDSQKIDALRQGRAVFFEPGLGEILARGSTPGSYVLARRSLTRHDSGTCFCLRRDAAPSWLRSRGPERPASRDLRAGAACLVAGRSPVPMGTASRLAATLCALAPAAEAAELAWNPEFLAEGSAVQDTLRPDRLVAGSRSAAADATLRSVYVLPLGQWRAAGWTVRSLAGVR